MNFKERLINNEESETPLVDSCGDGVTSCNASFFSILFQNQELVSIAAHSSWVLFAELHVILVQLHETLVESSHIGFTVPVQ